MIQAKKDLLGALADVIEEVAPGSTLTAAFESPKQAAHGDLACTAAMPLAKALKKNPRELAAALIAGLQRRPAVGRWVEALEVAGPGFINLRLKPAARQAVVGEILVAGDAFGRAANRAQTVLVEFVSANPTGPLHVGHARQAALGDAICNLFDAQGWQVTREFYYNDAGVQIATLAASVQARLRGLVPGEPGWPEAAYNGDYIADIAADFRAGKTVAADDRDCTASGNVDDIDSIRAFAVAYLRHEQDLDLQAFGVRFDRYFLESSLYTSGRVATTVQRLIDSGKTFEQDGALWLRSTDYGDDKDRVMRKSDGSFTYFLPDVAYHLQKFERGFRRAINIQGGDHHGTIARVRAGLQAADAGVPVGYPDYLLHKMVTVMKGGQEVKISKRAGSYVTLRDLIDWTSRDAVRFFLLSRKADTEFVFDVDLALKQNDENPVFYVQYAHARICSVIRLWSDKHGIGSADRRGAADSQGAADIRGTAGRQGTADRHGAADSQGADDPFRTAELSLLTAPTEAALMLKLAEFPPMLANAADGLAPHDVAFYLRDLAGAFHSYYGAERILGDDAKLERARVALLAATRQVVRNALGVLGVGAPEQMAREAPPRAPEAATT